MERLPEPRPGPLTDRERQALAQLAAHESAADPEFAAGAGCRGWWPRRSR